MKDFQMKMLAFKTQVMAPVIWNLRASVVQPNVHMESVNIKGSFTTNIFIRPQTLGI